MHTGNVTCKCFPAEMHIGSVMCKCFPKDMQICNVMSKCFPKDMHIVNVTCKCFPTEMHIINVICKCFAKEMHISRTNSTAVGLCWSARLLCHAQGVSVIFSSLSCHLWPTTWQTRSWWPPHLAIRYTGITLLSDIEVLSGYQIYRYQMALR